MKTEDLWKDCEASRSDRESPLITLLQRLSVMCTTDTRIEWSEIRRRSRAAFSGEILADYLGEVPFANDEDLNSVVIELQHSGVLQASRAVSRRLSEDDAERTIRAMGEWYRILEIDEKQLPPLLQQFTLAIFSILTFFACTRVTSRAKVNSPSAQTLVSSSRVQKGAPKDSGEPSDSPQLQIIPVANSEAHDVNGRDNHIEDSDKLRGDYFHRNR